MVDDRGISWPKFQSANEPAALPRNAQHEHAQEIGAPRRERVWLVERQHLIRGAQLPSRWPRRRASQLSRLSFRRARLNPALDAIDLVAGQRMLVNEVAAVLGLSFPRRHQTPSRDLGDLR